MLPEIALPDCSSRLCTRGRWGSAKSLSKVDKGFALYEQHEGERQDGHQRCGERGRAYHYSSSRQQEFFG